MSDRKDEKDADEPTDATETETEVEAGTEAETATDEVFVEDVIVEEKVPDPPLDAADGAEEAAPDEQPPVDAAPAAAAPAAKRGGGALAFLALVVSAAALAAVGYLYYSEREAQSAADRSSESIAALSGRLDESRQSLSELDQDLAELAGRDQGIESRIADLQRGLDQRLDLIDSLPPRMTTLENSLASLQGISADARDTWLLAEAEYYMQIANAQLQLAGNPTLAALALGMADERIVQTANPALIDVRRKIADELAALELMDKVDTAGITLTLASLARVVESLPLKTITDQDEETGELVGEEASGVARAWDSVKGAMSDLVKVTPLDETRTPLMTPEAEGLLRANLSLQLQAARLALLRGEQAIFEQSLDDADAWIAEYFDTDSAQVGSARETIAELRSALFSSTAPDISESLRLLRQFKTLSESAQ